MSNDLEFSSSGEMEPRAATEEKILRALSAVAQRVFEQTGIKINSANFEWIDRPVNEQTQMKSVICKSVVRKASIKTTVTETQRNI